MDTIEQFKNIRSGPILIGVFVLSIVCFYFDHRMERAEKEHQEHINKLKFEGHIEIVEKLTRGDWGVKIRSADQLPLHSFFMVNRDGFFTKYKFSQGDSVSKKENSMVFTFYRKGEGDTLIYNY